MGTLEHINRFSNSRQRPSSVGAKGIFYQFEVGENRVRLVGDFVEVKTHFISPAPSRGQKGLCIPEAFQGENKLPAVINCNDWDVENEKARKSKTCPICALNRIYKDLARKPGISTELKAQYDEMARSCAPRTALKWNIIDRKDPFIIESKDGVEKQVKGYKIATIGMEAWNDIQGIFSQCGFDVADLEEGADIIVERNESKGKTSYSARVVLERGAVARTPLTTEEREMKKHDLIKLSSKLVNPEDVRGSLHSEYAELLDSNPDDEEGVVEEEAPKAAPKAAPVAKKSAPAPVVEEEVDEEVDEEAEAAAEAAEDEQPLCFGQIDADHPECKACVERPGCAKKSGVKL